MSAYMGSDVGKGSVADTWHLKAVVVSLPTIESSFAIHTARCFSGYTHPDYPALRVAMEVLNGTESFLWVRVSSPHHLSVDFPSKAVYPRFWPGIWREYGY